MNPFEIELTRRLAALRAQGLSRELRQADSAQGPRIQIGGRTLLNFSSNDYLGLANHPALKEAAIRAIERFGAGSGASRLLCGSLAPHHELEAALAAFKGCEAALSFSSGYAAALGTICALLGRDDIVIVDKLVHACIVDAARLCGAKIRVFAHNDLADLEKILKWASGKNRQSPIANRQSQSLIVTESVFSMDGDHAPLRELVALKEQYGAWLMVDEAHATGLYGPTRRGLAEELGVSDRIEIQMGTLGKALGASGGFICGSRALIDLLIHRARSFIFSTAPVPAAAAAATAAVRLVQSETGEERRRTLWQRVAELRSRLPLCPSRGLPTTLSPREGEGRGENSSNPGSRFEPPNRKTEGAPASSPAWGGRPSKASGDAGAPVHGEGARFMGLAGMKGTATRPGSAIIPLIVGDEAKAVALAAQLREHGFFVPAIRYPTVARGRARLRVTLTAAHTVEDVQLFAAALASVVNRPA